MDFLREVVPNADLTTLRSVWDRHPSVKDDILPYLMIMEEDCTNVVPQCPYSSNELKALYDDCKATIEKQRAEEGNKVYLLGTPVRLTDNGFSLCREVDVVTHITFANPTGSVIPFTLDGTGTSFCARELIPKGTMFYRLQKPCPMVAMYEGADITKTLPPRAQIFGIHLHNKLRLRLANEACKAYESRFWFVTKHNADKLDTSVLPAGNGDTK